jgi:excisionase family DNA binding protein
MEKYLPTPETRYLTTAEVAELLRTPAETCRYWRHLGKGLASLKIGRRVLYAESDVRAWIEAQRATAGVGAPSDSAA